MACKPLKHSQLLSDLKSFGSDSFEPVRKVVRKTSTLKKSQTVQEAMLKAGMDPSKLKPFTGKPAVMREQTSVGDAVAVKGRKAVKAAPLPDLEDVGVPAALRHEHLKRAIVAHAAANDNPNEPITEPMLNRVLKMAKAGQLTNDQARRTVEYHGKGLALPTDVMRAIGGN